MQHHGEPQPSEPSAAWRRWLPGILVVLFLGAVVTGGYMGVRALIDTSDAEGVAPSPVIENPSVAPEPRASEPLPTATTYNRPVYASSGREIGAPEGKALISVDGLYYMDISTYVDRQIVDRLIVHGEHIGEPESLHYAPFREGGNRWWHEVVTTPASEGGPSLEHAPRYAEILDRWHAGDYSDLDEELAWLKTAVQR